ncbi:uncharacterized protein BDCG_02791 [Blastomyces dermatitidis ER-3]|uniref:ATP phosphoribosyltransferase n=2 Tax=Blastomyces TaxID=229219 RepID=A0A179UPI5_BLAGS|nr:UPF0135 protein yqfO [Blastomyces gilchristii SLH14081]XP_045274957.1 uncharacterized protein BDCG_02791 [Blastomyces dermatitidis ER-3]EEQ87671.2 hypothetical protein BDCG_02791 [Blastomyces dermatitidis ER-3]EQL38014.1 hypothetical protein BDFG_00419 [Blastomyces dermatitidis ATCC 26199]OAT09743.1 UPF0135 protein yqfO [Blastomyces gilchristii SLH14081]
MLFTSIGHTTRISALICRSLLSPPHSVQSSLIRSYVSSPLMDQDRFKLVFFAPLSHVEACKDAVFDAGAGQYPQGKYTRVCFQSPGTGQFLPGGDANPNIGKVGALEFVEEMRVEVLCMGRTTMQEAVKALVKAHPYEEPGYEVYKLENVSIEE